MRAALIWLVITLIFVTDTQLLIGLLGDRVGPRARQWWLAVPMLFAPVGLLLTPWRMWSIGAVAVAAAVQLALHLLWWRRVRWGLSPAPPAVLERVGQMAAGWGTAAPQAVLLAGSDGPAVAGLVRRTLVVPESALDYSDEEWAAVIAHELAHVRGWDPLKLWLIGVGRVLLGWLPPVWPSLTKLPLEIELAADEQAVAWLGDARAYGVTLGRLGLREAGLPEGAALAGHPADLLVRVRAVGGNRVLPNLTLPGWMPSRVRARAVARMQARTGLPVEPHFGYTLIALLGPGYLLLLYLCLRWLG